MILQFLTAYAELVAELTRVGGPQHHDLTGNLEKDVRADVGEADVSLRPGRELGSEF